MSSPITSISVVDSHTAGEPTRVVVDGIPDLSGGSVADQLKVMKATHDHFRKAIVLEPRGSEVMVGAALVPTKEKDCITGVVFFNNMGYLGMCGHGLIGVIRTLQHLGRISYGCHMIETSVGIVHATLERDDSVTIRNVPSYRKHRDIEVNVAGLGTYKGDIAWGGNWFYLVEDHGEVLALENLDRLMKLSTALRREVNNLGHTEVDHVDLFGKPRQGGHSRNFVLCPGMEYDRSPCGTGTSAKLACLAADGKLAPGETWIQESIIDSTFNGAYQWHDQAAGTVVPTINGRAYVCGESRLILQSDDPFRWGIPSSRNRL